MPGATTGSLFLARRSPERLVTPFSEDARASNDGVLKVLAYPQSQSRRLKIRYRLTQTIPISPIANGYPNPHRNSGMCVKFMP